jgi:hypothetical protein
MDRERARFSVEYGALEGEVQRRAAEGDTGRHAVKLLDGLGSSASPPPNAGRQRGDKGRLST